MGKLIMADEYKTLTEYILEITNRNTSSTKPADVIESRAKIAKEAVESWTKQWVITHRIVMIYVMS